MVDQQIKLYQQKLSRNTHLIMGGFLTCFFLLIGTQQYMNSLKSDYDSLINISGRQRMLSQKLAYLKTINSKPVEFKTSLNLFKFSHERLNESASHEIKLFYQNQVNPIFNKYISIITSPETSHEIIFTDSQKVLKILNEAVTLFEKESNTYEQWSNIFNMALSIIGFILLAILYFKILLPQKESMLHGLKGYYYEKQKADESSRIKSAFIANMTHELRTPMNGVIGFSQLLKETQLNPEQESYLGNLDKASHALLEIINDILDFSKLESGNIVINSVNVNHQEITHEIVSILHPIAIQKNIEIKYIIDENLPSYVLIDPLRLKQILINLINNAIKFTKEGNVTLHIKEQGDFILFEVSDTGIGIPPEQVNLIFQEFQQIENTYVKTQEGTGLGLSLVKKFVDLMDGYIEVDSEVGKGSKFSVFLPLIRGEEPKNKAVIKEGELNIKVEKILVVEDNKMNQLVIGSLLKKLEVPYEFADNGKEAVKICKNNTFDLILMDISMPILNGFDATKAIRKFDEKTPIICLSANVFSNDREKAIYAGMNDFLEKPIKKEKLVHYLNKYLSKKEKP